MKIKLYRIGVTVLPVLLLVCASSLLSSCSGDEYDNVTGYKLTDTDGKTMLEESKNIFSNEIGTVLQPDFTTLFDKRKGLKSTTDDVTLNPVWDDAIFSEDESRYTLSIPLEGAVVNSAYLSCQADAGEGCVLLGSGKVVDYYLMFVRGKQDGAIAHKVVSTLTGRNPDSKNRLADCVVYSDEHGLCDRIVALTGEGETELYRIEKPVLNPDRDPEFAYVNLNIPGHETEPLYFGNGKALVQKGAQAINNAMRLKAANDKDPITYCDICGMQKTNGKCYFCENSLDNNKDKDKDKDKGNPPLTYCTKCGGVKMNGGCSRGCDSQKICYLCGSSAPSGICTSPWCSTTCNYCYTPKVSGKCPNKYCLANSGGSGSKCPNDGNAYLYPRPSNCSEYYECYNGYREPMGCPENLYFCPEKSYCSWISDPDCKYDCTLF